MDEAAQLWASGNEHINGASGNGATGVSDMAGKAAQVAVEAAGCNQDTNEVAGMFSTFAFLLPTFFVKTFDRMK